MTNNEEFEKILENIDENGPEPQEEPQRQYYFMKKARAILKQKAEEKGLQISLHNTDVEAYFDLKWTGEAIGNVIDNAIKYTEHGEICVSAISYEMFVRIDIADTGCGIREEELPKIFRRFYRSELVKDEEGVGIGLYLTREILQEQGGYIKVSSVYGQGSKFSIYLPKNNF